MIDTTTTLVKAYFDALKALDVPVFSFYAPVERAGKEYIVIRQFSRVDNYRAGSIDTVQVSIIVNVDRKEKGINRINEIANDVFSKVYKNNHFTLKLDDVQNSTNSMIGDKTTFLELGQNIQAQRVLLFEHEIYFENY